MNKRHYSYFLIKPDGMKYFKEIKENLNSKKFDRILYFAVNDWEKLQKDVYEEHYKKEGFSKAYQPYVEAEKKLFGNRTIAIVVCSMGGTYQELMDKVYSTKLELRNKLDYRLGLVTVSNEFDEKKANQILIAEEQGKRIKKTKRFSEEHKKYGLNHLDLIHCPDPKKEVTLQELNKLFKQGIISDKNILSPEMIENIEKYKTSEFLQEQMENQIQTSNYSGHILQEIEENEL